MKYFVLVAICILLSGCSNPVNEVTDFFIGEKQSTDVNGLEGELEGQEGESITPSPTPDEKEGEIFVDGSSPLGGQSGDNDPRIDESEIVYPAIDYRYAEWQNGYEMYERAETINCEGKEFCENQKANAIATQEQEQVEVR